MKKSWVIICNTERYDINSALTKLGTILWSNHKIKCSPGDYAYIYLTKPVKGIAYKCEITENHLKEYSIDDSEYILDDTDYTSSKDYLKLKLIKKFERTIPLELLKLYNLNTVQSSSTVNDKLQELLNSLENNQNLGNYIEIFKNNGYEIALKDYKETEELRIKFISQYSDSIANLSLEEYAVGHGKESGSFCYQLETTLDKLGNIHGANAKKFGIYFSKDQNRYIFAEIKFGKNQDTAFKNIKDNIDEIIRISLTKSISDAERQKIILDNKISQMLKGKILYIYNPSDYLNIFSNKHLDYFIKTLHLENKPKSDFLEKQKALIAWKNSNNILKEWNNFVFTRFLYVSFGKPDYEDYPTNSKIPDDNKLRESILEYKITKKKINYEPKPVARPKQILTPTGKSYPRKRSEAIKALILAEHRCEIKGCNQSLFKRRIDGLPYTEPHHLIPMSAQEKFKNSLDVAANIVSLCSSCHNQIHYGENAKELIDKLYDARIKQLKTCEIACTKEDLENMYLMSKTDQTQNDDKEDDDERNE